MDRSSEKRVLVIDDDPAVCVAIKTALTRAGYDVNAMSLLSASVQASLTGDYTLITLDLRMPGADMQGEEIAELLNTRKVPTPVLVISGNLDEPTTERLRELGVEHFLGKPFTIAELLGAVEAAVSGTRG